MTDVNKLPQTCRDYIKRIEEVTGVPVAILSTGPDRVQTMILRDPFAALKQHKNKPHFGTTKCGYFKEF